MFLFTSYNKTWTFTYDGVRVKEVFEASGVTITKHFFAGGAYEVEVDSATPSTPKITRYYSIAGTRIAMNDGTGRNRGRNYWK
ncbi:MAG: hypothetical protein OEY93_07855 [Anaerolineae bacterium]|nr:hypothetical protein [Anaerolineae bacterium]